MRPKIQKNCRFFFIDLDSLVFGEINDSKVGVYYKNRIPYYFKLNCKRRLIITQSLNEKTAAARMISIYLRFYKK